MQSKEITWAVLGHLANQYQNSVSLSLVNSYFKDYGLDQVNQQELMKLVGEVSVKDSEANRVYLQYKLGKDLNSIYQDDVTSTDTYKYIGKDNHPHQVTLEDLKNIALIVDELQQASPSHTFSWRKVEKLSAKHDLIFSSKQEFKDKVLAVLDEMKEQPSVKKSPKQARFLQETLTDELGILATRKRALQNDQRHINKARRVLSDVALTKQAIIEAMAEPLIIKQPSKEDVETYDQEDNTLFVCISDVHMGAVQKLNSSTLASYNTDEAHVRLNRYLHKAKETIRLYHPKEVNVVMMGDLVENVQMRKNQGWSVQGTLAQQIRWGSSAMVNFMSMLSHTYPDLTFTYTEIEGNHDRFAPDKKDELPQDGVSLVARTIIDTATKGIKNLYVLDPEDEYRHLVQDHGNNLLFVHGDKDKLANKDILGKLSTFLDTPLDAVIGGHLHSLQAHEVGNRKLVLQTGSVIGSTDYSNSLGVASAPSQLMILSNEEGIQPIFTFL